MSAARGIQLIKEASQLAATGDKQGTVRALEEAIATCQAAVQANPDDIDAVAVLGSCYIKLGRHAEAAEAYRRAVALNPGIALFQQNLGMSLLRLSQHAAAESAFRKAIALAPSAHTYSGLADILLGRGETKGAADCLRKAYGCEPETAVGKFYLGRGLVHEGKLEEAEKAFRAAIELRPSFGDAYRLLGETLQQLGRFEDAEAALLKAIEFNPRGGHAYISITAGRKMTEEDRPLIEKMRSLAGSTKVADACSLHYALGKSLNDLGEYEAALAEYDAANSLAAKIMLQGKPFDKGELLKPYQHATKVFTKRFFDDNRSLGNESEMPIFIVGMIRSGTTLIEQIVSSHPDVGAGGELPFWYKVGNEVLDASRERPNEKRLLEVQTGYLELLQALAPDKSRVTDKQPSNCYMLGQIHLAFPKAKIIHCLRDPVDTALSIYMTPNWAPIVFAYDRANIVFAYKEYRKLMDFYREVLPPETMLEVRYEDIVADRETQTRRLIDFLGLEWDDACLHHEDNKRSVTTPSLWQARQPIYTSSVKRWKKYEPWLGAFKELIEEG